jgi:hypothetical protein
MFLGADIHDFMDHKNLMFDTLETQHVLCWHMKIEALFLAKNLSRLNCLVTPA